MRNGNGTNLVKQQSMILLKMKFQRGNVPLSKSYLTIWITIFGFCSTVVGAQKQYFGRKLTGHIINSLVTVSLESCNDECNIRTSCRSINYHRKKKLCELNSKSIQDKFELDNAPDYVFREKLTAYVGPCDDECPPGTLCDNDNSCKYAECGKFHVKNGIAYGNMKNVGSKSEIKCREGYAVDERMSVAQCGRAGGWNVGDEVVCKQVCEIPEEINGGDWSKATIQTLSGQRFYDVGNVTDILQDKIIVGSSLTFSCDDDLQLYGSPTIQCEAGKWTKHPECFYKYCKHDIFCPEPTLVCSNNTCSCKEGQTNYSVKRCVETCPEVFPEAYQKVPDTYPQPIGNRMEEFVSEEQFVFLSQEECQEICLLSPEYLCDGSHHGPSTVVFDDVTCLVWSMYLVDWANERTGHNQRDCMKRQKQPMV